MVKPFLSTLALSLVAGAFAFDPGQTNWFIGRDTLTTISAGPFAGQANPNLNRIVFLYGHQYETTPEINHFHGKSTYTYYRETVGGPVLIADTNVRVDANGVGIGFNNVLPEDVGVTVRLFPGSGTLAGSFVTGLTDGNVAWEDQRVRPAAWLSGFAAGTPERNLWDNLGTTRYQGSLGSANLALEIVELSPGLSVWNTDLAVQADAAGERVVLGTGNFLAEPTFAFAGGAGQSASALFRIVDTTGGLANSGTVRMNFQAVPEPASLAVLGFGGLALLRRRRRA